MRSVAIAFLILFAGALWAQQDVLPNMNSCTAANGSAQTCAFPKNVTSGNILICGADTFGTLTGISDTRSSIWTPVENFTGGGLITRLWVAAAGGSGADTVTVTGTNNSNGMNCLELPASQWTTTVDAHGSNPYSSSPATVTSNTLTAPNNGDFFYMYTSGFQNGGTLQPVSPLLTAGAGTSNDNRAAGYKVTGVNGNYSGVMNNTGNTQGGHVELILAPVSGVTITTSSLPTGSTSHAYSYPLVAIGGVGAYTWSISSGSLPSGLSINSSTGVISGTPTGGTQTFTVQAVGATSGTGTKSLTLTVNSSQSSPAFVQNSSGGGLSAPNGGSVTATSGNVNVVGIYLTNQTMGLGVPTDTLTTPYKYCGSIQMPPTGGHIGGLAIYIGLIPSTGTNQVTAPAATATGINVDEFSGVQASCETVVFTSGKSASSATLTSNSITTTVPNSMLTLQVNAWTNNTTFTKDAAFTGDGSGQNAGVGQPMFGEYATEASPGAFTPTFAQTGNTSGEWDIFAVQLMPSTSGTVATAAVQHRGDIL